MKNSLILCLVAATACACASQPEVPAPNAGGAENVYAPKSPIYTQLAPRKAGELAYVVERLAKQSGCELYENAQLMAKRPGIQFYRVPCADGAQILYKCEIRHCAAVDR